MTHRMHAQGCCWLCVLTHTRPFIAICTDASFRSEQPLCHGDESPCVPARRETRDGVSEPHGAPPMALFLSWFSSLAGKVCHLSLSARGLGSPHTAASVPGVGWAAQ